jgi:hypothetical protein
MSPDWDHVGHWLRGPLLTLSGRWPVNLAALLCDLRPRLLPKGRAGRGYRAVARNGRVLVASDRPLAELPGLVSQVRIQTWHRVLLPGDRPEPYGLLLCIRSAADPCPGPVYATRLVPCPEEPFDLALDLGGGLVLEFRSRVGPLIAQSPLV